MLTAFVALAVLLPVGQSLSQTGDAVRQFQQLSPAERQALSRQFQSLPESQRQQLMRQLGIAPDALGQRRQPRPDEFVQPIPGPRLDEFLAKIAEPGELRISGDDTLIITIRRLSDLPELQPGGVPSTGLQPGFSQGVQPGAQQGTQPLGIGAIQSQLGQPQQPRQPPRGTVEEEEIELPSFVETLLGSQVYRLDQNGVLSLSGIGRLSLMGLTAEEAAARIAAEPPLKDVDVQVRILPLEPTGPEALQPFGYDLFADVPSTFAPVTDIPVPADYVIGPGDTINIQLFGKENIEYELVVQRDGTVLIPELGPRTVAGLTFEEMYQRVQQYVSEQMIGVRAAVTMGQLRTIRVFVLGETQRPGSYTVGGLSTITNSLFASGGVQPIGSLRNIQLKRNGKLVQTLDLYDLLLRGDTSKDVRLRPGDVIFVPPVGKTVGVAGEVRRPAIYELRGETNLNQVIAMAGGLAPTAATDIAQIERITVRGERTVIDVSIRNPQATVADLSDGDVVRIHSVLDRIDGYVRLSGHVERPGHYQWRPGMRLTDLIPTVDYIPPRADLDYVLIKRELSPNDRIELLSAQLRRAWAYEDSSDNIELQSRDEIIVFSQDENRADLLVPIIERLRLQARAGDPERVVVVNGLVPFPGEYPLEGGMRVSDLIRAAGGLSQEAYGLEAEVSRFEIVAGKFSELRRIDVDLAALRRGESIADILLQPFDTLNIKQVPEWRERQIVEVRGEVLFPGEYVIQKGETVRDVIYRAGGFTEHAFPRGAVFLRVDLREKEQEQFDRLRQRLRSELAAITLQRMNEDAATAEAVAMAESLLDQLAETEAIGRMVIDLPRVMVNDSTQNVSLKNGDKLLIPDKPHSVTVIGEVNYPTSHVFDPTLTRGDFIQRSGGFTQQADKGRIYVVRASGEVIGASSTAWFASEQEIEVGDTIVVPLDADRIRPLKLWTSIAQIIYQLGLAAAAANAVGVFN